MAKASWCSWRAQGLIYKPHTRIPYFQCGTQVHTLHLDPNNDLFVILLLLLLLLLMPFACPVVLSRKKINNLA